MLAPINEQVFLPTVAVDVDEQMHIAALKGLADHVLHRMNLRRLLQTRILPLAVQIKPRKTASVIADNYAIWVQHWHDFEYKMVSESFGARFTAQNKLEKAFHDKTCV